MTHTNLNFKEELKLALMAEYPAVDVKTVDEFVEASSATHLKFPNMPISAYVHNFVSGRSKDLDTSMFAKPLNSSFLDTPNQPSRATIGVRESDFAGDELNTFHIPDCYSGVAGGSIVSESISGKEVIKPYNGELEIRTLTAENGETAEVVMDNTPTYIHPTEPRANGHYPGMMVATRTHHVDHEREDYLSSMLGDTKPNKALLAEIMKCGDEARGGELLVSIAAIGNKSPLQESNPIGCEANNEKLVEALIKSRNLSSELEYNYGKGVDRDLSFLDVYSLDALHKATETGETGEPMSREEYAKRRLKTIDIIKLKQTYMTATVKRKRCKTFTNDFMGTQRIKKYVTSMLPKGSDCYHVALRNDQGIEVFIMLPNRNILSEIVGAKVDNVIRIPTNTPRRLHAFSKYKVLTPYKVVATTRFHDAT